MYFNDLLARHRIDPGKVLILRHRPHEPRLRKVLPWLAAERPATFNAYQQTQPDPRTEAAMCRADFVASFIGHEPGHAMFVGLYRRGSWRPLTGDEFWQIPEYIEMKSYGMQGFTSARPSLLFFDLLEEAFYREWKGRLIVQWPGLERSWWRWADRNDLAVEAILERSRLEREMPNWRELTLTWTELKLLPSSWKAALSQWRGIYFILDESDGRGYVGSACGEENILGRWMDYARSGHGGNAGLRTRDPSNFRFSILERVAPDLSAEEVNRIEANWKLRLHTREFGLNEN